jgi:crotonobetainyl-CoA:carnitine CoA-transferase CaiB-like acyl-CoA transferase
MLQGLEVVDCSRRIAGAYCSKLFADARARVLLVEPPGGHPLRTWTATGADLGGRDGALFRFLAAGAGSTVTGDGLPTDEILAGAHLLVETGTVDVAAVRARHPHLVVVSITPFGRTGPYADRPAAEFTIQAEAGSIAYRGLPDGVPYQAGGRVTEWLSGCYAAVGALAAVARADRAAGTGDHVDCSMHEMLTMAASTYADLMHSLTGRPPLDRPARSTELPSIEPTLDGWVGFNTNSRQQYMDFLVLIERPDLLEDTELAGFAGRSARMDEWNAIVRAWTTQHTTAEIVERAAALRIPVAPVNDAAGVLAHEHFRARRCFQRSADGDFEAPRPPYLLDGDAPPPPRPSPRLGQHDRLDVVPSGGAGGVETGRPPAPPFALPLRGLRVLDFTAWWAGPSATWLLGCLGADVIHVESIQKPDGMRLAGAATGMGEGWWERSAIYLASNSDKRGLTLNLADADGLRLAEQLIAGADVVVENFSPRVFDQFGLTWDHLRELNPRLVFVRMPAFGLDGPWRDHVGFAQTMEQVTGLAWVTGHVDDQPRIMRGPCDPLAGGHAAWAILLALAERERTGTGHFLECPMVEGALNSASESIVECSAYGRILQRDGNHSWWASPQDLYRTADGPEAYLAASCETDEQRAALAAVLGVRVETLDDDAVATWAAPRRLDEAVATLVAAGVPASALVDPRTVSTHPQHVARGYFETLVQLVAGSHPFPGPPFRFASRGDAGWLDRAAPALGEHNAEILAALGVDDDELARLSAASVIGNRPKGL